MFKYIYSLIKHFIFHSFIKLSENEGKHNNKMGKVLKFKSSKHLQKRSQQRGIKSRDIEYILDYADRVTYINGRESYSLSKKAIEELKNELPVKDLEKIKNLSVLIQDNIGITALKRTGTNGKHYFKQIKKKYNYRRSS